MEGLRWLGRISEALGVQSEGATRLLHCGPGSCMFGKNTKCMRSSDASLVLVRGATTLRCAPATNLKLQCLLNIEHQSRLKAAVPPTIAIAHAACLDTRLCLCHGSGRKLSISISMSSFCFHDICRPIRVSTFQLCSQPRSPELSDCVAQTSNWCEVVGRNNCDIVDQLECTDTAIGDRGGRERKISGC